MDFDRRSNHRFAQAVQSPIGLWRGPAAPWHANPPPSLAARFLRDGLGRPSLAGSYRSFGHAVLSRGTRVLSQGRGLPELPPPGAKLGIPHPPFPRALHSLAPAPPWLRAQVPCEVRQVASVGPLNPGLARPRLKLARRVPTFGRDRMRLTRRLPSFGYDKARLTRRRPSLGCDKARLTSRPPSFGNHKASFTCRPPSLGHDKASLTCRRPSLGCDRARLTRWHVAVGRALPSSPRPRASRGSRRGWPACMRRSGAARRATRRRWPRAVRGRAAPLGHAPGSFVGSHRHELSRVISVSRRARSSRLRTVAVGRWGMRGFGSGQATGAARG